MNRYKKLLTGFGATAALGTVLGVLAKLCDTAGPTDFLPGNLFYGFGLISSGLLFWAFLCAVLSLNAKNGLHAALLTLCLLTPMLVSYYTVSRYYVGYYEPGIARFWGMMLLPSAIGAWILRANRHVKWFRMLTAAGAVCCFLFDRVHLLYGSLRAEVAEMMLLAGLLAVLYTADRQPDKPRQSAVLFRYRQQTEI